jgi:DNA-binding LytR/AlgR family response regulator
MKKLELLLLEDTAEEAEELIEFLEENNYQVELAVNASEARKKLRDKQFDVIVLDIMINGKPEGISLAQEIQDYGINIPFLFLTSMQSKSIFQEAKYTKPFNYLIKPYNELELLYALELAIESHYEQSNSISIKQESAVLSPDFLFIKKKGKVVKVAVSDINSIQVEEKYCSLYCDDGSYLIRMSLKKAQQMLGSDQYLQIHRNSIVNITKIKEIYFEDNLIVLDNDDQISMSERYKNTLKKNPLFFK